MTMRVVLRAIAAILALLVLQTLITGVLGWKITLTAGPIGVFLLFKLKPINHMVCSRDSLISF